MQEICIQRDTKLKYTVLDPVMGDEGKIYVSEEVVPAYKSLLRDADLILPNQFEAEYVPVASKLGVPWTTNVL